MFEEDQDTLAAEYVLGTLSAEEREHAEALLSFDPGFEAAVRQWERRLGELNVMVEAVEPPTELWDKIKKEIAPDAPPALPFESHDTDAAVGADAAVPHDLDAPSTVSAVASDLLLVEKALGSPLGETTAETLPHVQRAPPPLVAEPRGVERGADVIDLRKRVGRWRGLTIAFGAIAALLAAYIAVSQVAPDLIPPQLRAAGSRMIARTDGNGRAQQDRLVAVLQQQPTAPAFLLTVDTLNRTLVVRRVSAAAETSRSYELWLKFEAAQPRRVRSAWSAPTNSPNARCQGTSISIRCAAQPMRCHSSRRAARRAARRPARFSSPEKPWNRCRPRRRRRSRRRRPSPKTSWPGSCPATSLATMMRHLTRHAPARCRA